MAYKISKNKKFVCLESDEEGIRNFTWKEWNLAKHRSLFGKSKIQYELNAVARHLFKEEYPNLSLGQCTAVEREWNSLSDKELKKIIKQHGDE